MDKNKRILELQLEDNSIPWQLAEGDSETWIVLRQRVVIAPEEIEDIQGASVLSSSWKIVSQDSEGGICKGSVGIVVNYKLKEHSSMTQLSDSAAAEESLFQECLQKNIKLVTEKSISEGEENGTSFSSLIIKEPSKTKNILGEERALDLPWQARICYTEEAPEPRVALIHLFQEGISTISVEVLLKLESKKGKSRDIKEKNKQLHFPSDEGVAVISGDKIQELIALVTKRSFKSIDCGTFGQILHVKAVIRYALLYLSVNKGGPRIQIATCFKEEENILKLYSLLPYQPAQQRYYLLSSVLTKIDVQRAAYKNEFMLEVVKDMVPDEKGSCVSEEIPVKKENVIMSVNTRKMPFEKWLKKGTNKAQPLNKNKTVLCIKLQ